MGRNLFSQAATGSSSGRNLFASTMKKKKKKPATFLDKLGYLGKGAVQGVQEIGQGIKQLGYAGAEQVRSKDPSYMPDIEKQPKREYERDVQVDRKEFAESPAGKSWQGQTGKFFGGTLPYAVAPTTVPG